LRGVKIVLLTQIDAPKPTLVSDEKKIYYETLKKFSFYESGEWGIK